MKIAKRIIIIFVTVSLIPIIAISTLSSFTIFNVSNDNAALAATALKNEELANLQRISEDVSAFIDERMQSYIDGVYIMEAYCEALFNNDINATSQYSYFWDPDAELAESGMTIPGIDRLTYDPDYDSYDISFDVSCWYMPPDDYQTPSDPWDWSPTTQYFIEKTSNMDNVFRSLHAANEDYIWLYMGFNPAICDTRLMRNYPYDNLGYFMDWYGPDQDYDPTIESWYLNAAAINDDSITFTPNYDPSTDWVLSIGRPVRYSDGTLIGVVSADLTMATITSRVNDIKVLTNGYAYLLDRNGGVVAHKDLDPGIEDIPSIGELEFGTNTNEIAAFTSLLDEQLEQESGLANFTKNGEIWHIAHVNVTDDGFTLVLVVPDSDIVAPAQEMLAEVLGTTNTLLIILFSLLGGVAVVVSVASYKRGQAVVEPIQEMTRLVDKMSKQDFTRSISATGALYEEIGTTVDALLSFQEACRFGNQAFVRGDLNRALANYMNLLEISQRIRVDIGIQTMYLNIGNVFRQRGDTGTALNYYEHALELANAMLNKAEKDSEEEADAMRRVASVYHNMALVEMDRGGYDNALKHLEDAEAIDTILRNTRGLARRYDAMGLIMTKQGRFSQAQSRFEEARTVAKQDKNDRTLAYIQYHMGEFFEEQQKWKKAEDALEEAIDLGNRVEEYPLVVLAMQKLADVLDQLDKQSHDVRRDAELLRRKMQFKKSVVFVIDYSGSMQAQNRIRAAVEGAKEILHSQVNPQDTVSIIVFNDAYRELLPLTQKGNYENPRDSPIWRALDSLRYPTSATAFYDALGKALQELDKVESSEHRWVIALTDGQDNSSDEYSLDYLEGVFLEKHRQKRRNLNTIEEFIRSRHLDVNLIVIGVGQELRNPIEQNIRSPRTGRRLAIEELLQSICDNVPQGQYLSVVDSIDVESDIQKAFQEAAVLMAQLELGGSTVDY